MQYEPRIRIGDREELIAMLSEAAALEHNVMCCYLYGLWSLKCGEADGLTPDQARIVAQWKQDLRNIAIEEMGHFAQVGNLTAAIGAAPYLSRPNFPVPAAYHPASIDLELVGFCRDLIEHAIYLERPEGIQMRDAPEFVHPDDYVRAPPKNHIMPLTQDYKTIGHLYRGIYHGFEVLARRYGEPNVFCGNVHDQISSADASLSDLVVVTDLNSAREAIETIVEQGEGAPGHSSHSHYNRFLAVRDQFDDMRKSDPAFEPAFPVARNPVMRSPHDPENRVWITDPEAVNVLDVGNAIYAILLRFLAQSFGRDRNAADRKALFVGTARRLMHVLTDVCEYLATLPAGPNYPGVNAGMSFTMLRDVSRLPSGPGEMRLLNERMLEIAGHAERLFNAGHKLAQVAPRIRALADAIKDT